MWIIPLPLMIQVSKGTKFYMNLNQYRNTHYHTLNRAKVLFHDEVSGLIQHVPVMEQCSLEYTLYPPSKRLIDIANVCSIVDKFFSDTLVECGKLPDDNFNHVLGVQYLFGQIDRTNPRVDVTIRQFTP